VTKFDEFVSAIESGARSDRLAIVCELNPAVPREPTDQQLFAAWFHVSRSRAFAEWLKSYAEEADLESAAAKAIVWRNSHIECLRMKAEIAQLRALRRSE
jgi:hypothetical protein